jgi:DNA-binding IclR family transcriptional regulator
LFGNRDRIEVILAIDRSEDGCVNATDLAEETGLINSRVRAQLIALAEADLLDPGPSDQDRKRWYVRRQSPFWSACRDLNGSWIANAADQSE